MIIITRTYNIEEERHKINGVGGQLRRPHVPDGTKRTNGDYDDDDDDDVKKPR